LRLGGPGQTWKMSLRAAVKTAYAVYKLVRKIDTDITTIINKVKEIKK